jgi:hypothetical protein
MNLWLLLRKLIILVIHLKIALIAYNDPDTQVHAVHSLLQEQEWVWKL